MSQLEKAPNIKEIWHSCHKKINSSITAVAEAIARLHVVPLVELLCTSKDGTAMKKCPSIHIAAIVSNILIC